MEYRAAWVVLILAAVIMRVVEWVMVNGFPVA